MSENAGSIPSKSIPSTFETEKEPQGQTSAVPYTPEEARYRSYMIKRLQWARDQRESDYMEFNDNAYSNWYDLNARTANAYNPPKANREDTRIVTGTTLEKENSLLSAILNYNLEPNMVAFNKQNIKVQEVGELMEDLVRKSREMEYYSEKRPLIYKELFDQGTCFVEEVKVEQICVEKHLKEDWKKKNGVKVNAIKWERRLKKEYAKCEVNLLEGKKVFLGNIREFFLANQPYAFTVDVVPYDRAKYLYGDWDRFEHVSETIQKFDSESLEEEEYRDWSLLEQQPGFVEVIKYQDPWNNEFMIMLNGVMMLPIEFPLTAISPSGKYTFAKGDTEPMSRFFAYSRSIPAKTQVDQAVLDEVLRVLLLKFRQGAEPPMANKGNRVLSRKVFYPGTVTNSLNPDDIKPIFPQLGVSQAEFNVFDLLKRMIDEKTVSPTFSGDLTQSGTTATEIQEVKKQQMMKLGAVMLGVISLERQLAELRLHNILATWTEAVDERVDEVRNELKKIYRVVSIDTTLDNGQKGERIVSFDPTAAIERKPEEVLGMEEYMKRKHNRNVRFNFVNSDIINSLVSHWFITITPTERDSSELDRVLFSKNIAEAMQLFGPQSLGMEYIKERFASYAGEDPDKFFAKTPSPAMGVSGTPTAPGGDIAAQMMQKAAGGARTPQQPSLNTLQRA